MSWIEVILLGDHPHPLRSHGTKSFCKIMDQGHFASAIMDRGHFAILWIEVILRRELWMRVILHLILKIAPAIAAARPANG
jgi:uncharacterized protein (DUF983 family)